MHSLRVVVVLLLAAIVTSHNHHWIEGVERGECKTLKWLLSGNVIISVIQWVVGWLADWLGVDLLSL